MKGRFFCVNLRIHLCMTKMSLYGSIKYLEDREDEYMDTNMKRYAWVFKLSKYFKALDITKPLNFLTTIATVLDNLRLREYSEAGSFKIFRNASDLIKNILEIKPVKSLDVVYHQKYQDFLECLKVTPIPEMEPGETLAQISKIPEEFENSMKYAVSSVVEGCIFATAKIEIFCNLQKAVSKRIIRRCGRQQICKFKGIEMIYAIIDQSYLK